MQTMVTFSSKTFTTECFQFSTLQLLTTYRKNYTENNVFNSNTIQNMVFNNQSSAIKLLFSKRSVSEIFACSETF